MGCCLKIAGITIVIAALGIGYLLKEITTPKPMPNLPNDEYWGPGKAPAKLGVSIRPFKIEFSEQMVADLKYRLNNTRYGTPYEGIAFEYGFNHETLKTVVEFWEKEYKFTERENYLNSFPQFKTNIQGLDMHFIHVKPKVDKNTKVLPLLLLHGWPGSVREFYKLIPILTQKNEKYDFVFEVIAPSLPGFGFSQAAARPGLGIAQIAIVMSNLMNRLGHEKYYVQGGDWGSVIGSAMATLKPEQVLGYHTNMPVISTPLNYIKMFIGSLWPTCFIEKEFVSRVYPLSTRFEWLVVSTGHVHVQATKPDSLGAALEDSPSGLAAWILEKFSGGTNRQYTKLKDGGLTKKFTYTELIDNLMMYWVSKSANSALRIYAEGFAKVQRGLGLDRIPTQVPTAVARVPHEIVFFTRSQLEEKYPNLVQITDFKEGGHFAALEIPKPLADDIFLAAKNFQEFHFNKK